MTQLCGYTWRTLVKEDLTPSPACYCRMQVTQQKHEVYQVGFPTLVLGCDCFNGGWTQSVAICAQT